MRIQVGETIIFILLFQLAMSQAKPLKIDWFHSHIYFKPEEYEKAARVRENIRRGIGQNARVYELVDHPIGPHPLPMFEVDFPSSNLGKVVEVLLTYREGLSILVHPLSGDHIADHTEYPMWIGKPLELNIERMLEMIRMYGE